MQLNANTISEIDKTKQIFQDEMKGKMVNEVFRNIVTKSIPLKDGEKEKIDNPEFRQKFGEILSDVSRNMVNQFENVGQFDTGNLFTSMVTSITDSVSLEADYRVNKLFNEIQIGRVNQNDIQELNAHIHKAFENVNTFESEEVGKRFAQDAKFILATEAASDVIDRIKNDVKDAIEETETKNELVEGTTQEIIDYKKEIAPPDDQYQDPNDPMSGGDAGADPDADPMAGGDATVDTSDNGMGGDASGDGSGNQIYDDGTGTDPTSNGDPMSGGDAGADPNADPMAGGDATGDVGEGDDMSDMSDGTETNSDGDLDAGDGSSLGDMGDAADGVGGNDGEPDAGDLDGTGGDMGGAAAPQQPGVSDGNSNNNSGGITININGADLKATKESLDLFSGITLAQKRVPLHPVTFNNMKLPTIGELSAECANAGYESSEKEMKLRLDGLKYALKQQTNLSVESQSAISDKINTYGKIIGESLNNAKAFTKSMENAGITPNGLIYGNENTLCIARNIINRFLTKKQFVSPTVRPYNSTENVFANAFDIVQLRQYIDKKADLGTESVIVNDLVSRENLFYHNMINYDDPEVKKQASAIIDLSLMNFKKAMTPNFITDYRIKSWELNVGDKANKNINEEVVSRVKEKFKALWMRDLNSDEIAIIKGAANQDDVTELTPTPYEKFMITMSKEAINARGCEDPVKGLKLTMDEKKNIEWKSRLMTTAFKTMEAFGMIDSNDPDSFDKFSKIVGV